MSGGAFPYWPPTSPQEPAHIPGGQMGLELADLAVNQVPRGRSDEIPLKPVPIPRARKPEYPAMPTQDVGLALAPDLYSLFMQTQNMPREQLVAAIVK